VNFDPSFGVGTPMPCANVHLMLAGRVLEAWERTPSASPIPVAEAPVRAAFLSGALAPDAGFVPGVGRQMSELAHYVLPGDLCRRLLALASTDEERAFALGWATHVLADVELHPLVGRAVGERLFGDRDRRVNTADDVGTHVSIEVGLDVAVMDAEGAALPVAPSRAWIDGSSARYLARSLEATYELPWQPARLLRDQQRAAWQLRYWPTALGLVRRSGEGGLVARLLGMASSAAPPKSAPRGFFAPESPAPWLVDEVMERGAGFADRFQVGLEDGMESLGNRNLETGAENPRGSGHPATDRAWEGLLSARGQGGLVEDRSGPRDSPDGTGSREGDGKRVTERATERR